MNTPLKLALKYFRHQINRNIITIISVVMAVALFAATGMLIVSFQKMMQDTHRQSKGDWHYQIYTPTGQDSTIPIETAEILSNNVLVEEAGVAAEDTYLKVGLLDSTKNGESDNDYTYYNLKEYDATVLSMFPYKSRIVEGRMPENTNEICISNGSTSFWKDSSPLGKTVTFDIGTGIEFADDGVTDYQFFNSGTRTFTIVGIFDRFRYGKLPNISEAVTINPSGSHAYSVYLKVKSVPNYKNSINQIMFDTGLGSYAKYNSHDGYLRWIGQGADNMRYALIGVLIILFAIIMVAMTMVIKNSFTLSYSEKVTQFGLLRCIGTTKKQIRKIVLAEGIIIWAIAQPLGIVIALITMKFIIGIISNINLEMIENIQWVASNWPIVLSMLASFITIMISSWIPAKKASMISPVEAVRGNIISDEIDYTRGMKRQGKRIKTRKKQSKMRFAWSLANRNLKRNTARYRTTLISVIVSIVLFISVAGISIGMNYSLKNYAGGYSAEFFFSSNHHSPKAKEAYIDLENELVKNEQVELVQSVYPLPVLINIPTERIPKNYESTFRRYFMIDTPYIREDKFSMLGQALKEVDILPINRENYHTLRFNGTAPDYDQLVANNEVLICQTETLRKNGSMSVIKFCDFTKGDTLSIGTTFDDALIDIRQATIASELVETPWYAEGRNKGYIVVPEENILSYLSMYENADEILYNNGMVAIKAKDDMIEPLSTKLKNASKSSFGVYNGYVFLSPYEKNKKFKDTVLVMNIFIYGFITVIVLMCSLNIFNTIATNLSNRKREMAMLRSVGMSSKQLFGNLILECAIYGVKGTLYGGLLGIGSLYALTYLMNRFFVIDYQNPLIYLLSALVFSIGIAVVAGVGPINRIIKCNLVDALRDAD